MPRIEIKGQQFEVGDEFFKRSPDEQNSIVREIAKQAGIAPEPSGPADFLRSIPRGLARGATSMGRMLAGAVDPEGVASMPPEQQKETLQTAQERRGLIERKFEGAISGLPQPAGAAGRFGETMGEFLGDPLSYLGPGGMGAKVFTTATGAIGSQLAGELTGDNPAARIAGGVLGAKAPSAAYRGGMLPISAKRAADVAALRREGIEPSAGDITGRKAIRHLEEAGDYFGGGQSHTEMRENIAGQVTARLNRAMGVTPQIAQRLGEDINRITPEILNDTEDRIGRMFQQSTQRLQIRNDARLKNDTRQALDELAQDGLPQATLDRIYAQLHNIWTGFVPRAGDQWVLPGRSYHNLTKKDTPLDRAINDPDPNIAYWSTRMRSILDDSMVRQAARAPATRGAALQLLRQARSQWFHYLIARDATTRGGEFAQGGLISPQALRRELTSKADRRLRYALDRSELAPLARSGSAVMPQPRTSGTGERLTAQHIPTRLNQVPTAFGLGAGLTGRAVNSAPVQAWLKHQTLPGWYPMAASRAVAPSALGAFGQEDEPLAAGP